METINKKEAINFLKEKIKESGRRLRCTKSYFRIKTSINDKLKNGVITKEEFESQMEKIGSIPSHLHSSYVELEKWDVDHWAENVCILHILYNQIRENNKPHLGSLERDKSYLEKNSKIAEKIKSFLKKEFVMEVSYAS